MLGFKEKKTFKVCWYGVTPLFIFVIWMLNWIEYEPIKYGTYEFSSGALGFGWCIAVASLVVIPVAAVHTLLKAKGATFKEKFFYTLRPTIDDLLNIPNINIKMRETRLSENLHIIGLREKKIQ